MTEDFVDVMKGRWSTGRPIPPKIKEFFIVKTTGWTLEYVRNLPVNVHEEYEILCMLYDTLKPTGLEGLK